MADEAAATEKSSDGDESAGFCFVFIILLYFYNVASHKRNASIPPLQFIKDCDLISYAYS